MQICFQLQNETRIVISISSISNFFSYIRGQVLRLMSTTHKANMIQGPGIYSSFLACVCKRGRRAFRCRCGLSLDTNVEIQPRYILIMYGTIGETDSRQAGKHYHPHTSSRLIIWLGLRLPRCCFK